MRLIFAIGVVLATALPAAAESFVFISIAGEKKIAVYAMNEETGKLTHRHDVRINGEPGALATGPRRRFLFASHRSTGQISSFQIELKSGNLTLLSTVRGGADPAYLATDRSGRYLLSAYYRAGKVVVHRIHYDGRLDREPVHTVKTDVKAHAIITGPKNKFVFVPHTGPNAIFQFHFNAFTGKLTANDVPKIDTGKNTGPRHLAMTARGDFVYCDNEQGSSVTAYRLERNSGRLRPFQTLPTLPGGTKIRNSCSHLELTRNEEFLYAANRGHDSIAGYAVDSKTGHLTSLGQTPTEATPRSFSIDYWGRFLFAAGQSSGKLAAYRVDSRTGELNRVATYTVGKRPWWVLVVRMP